MKKKQRFSLRKNKIGTASVLLGLTIVGGSSYVGTQAQAAEVPKEETTIKQDKVYTVTDEQVLDAQKKVDSKQVEVNEKNKEVEGNKANLTDVQKEKDILKSKEITLTKEIDETKKITPDVIEGVKKDILEAEKTKSTKENELEQARKDEVTKLNTRNEVDEKVQVAQNGADEADKDVDTKKRALDPKEKDRAIEQLKSAERTLTDKQHAKDISGKELDQAKEYDKKLAQSKTDAKSDLDSKKQNKITKERELSEAKVKEKELELDLEKAKNPFGVKDIKYKISLDQNFVKALQEYLKNKNEENLKKVIEKEKVAVQNLASQYNNPGAYGNDDKVDIKNISEEDNLLFSQYVAMLNNQIRAQFGLPPKKVNINVQKFIADASKLTMETGFDELGHDNRSLNKSAYKHGIDSTDQGTLYNRFESLSMSFLYNSGMKIPKKYLFNEFYNSLLRFYYEGKANGHYLHAEHLLNDDQVMAVGLSIAKINGQGDEMQQLRLAVASLSQYMLENQADWDKRFSVNSKDTLDLIKVYTESEIREKESNLIKAQKEIENARKALDVATENETGAQAKLDELNKIKEKTSDAQKKLDAAIKELTRAENEKTRAEENLRNVTADQATKENALKTALVIQGEKHDALNKVKAVLVKAQADYDSAVNTRKNKDQELTNIKNTILALNDKKNDFESKLARLPESEKELVNVKDKLKDIEDKLTILLQTQSKLEDELGKLKLDLKDLEKEYKRLLEIYTKERMPESLQLDPDIEKPFIDIKEEVKEKELDYRTVEQNDPTLEEGKRVVKVKGKKGRKSIKTITLSEKGKVLDVVTQETIIEEVVDEVVLVGTKRSDALGVPGKDPEKSGDKASGSSKGQPDSQRQSVNANGLNKLPNTGQSQTGIATLAGLVALAVAVRLRQRKEK